MSRLYQRAIGVQPAGAPPGGPPFGDTWFTTSDEGGGVASVINHTASGPNGGHTYLHAEATDPANEIDEFTLKIPTNTVDTGPAWSKPQTVDAGRAMWYASETLPIAGVVYCELTILALGSVSVCMALGFDPAEVAKGPAINLRAHNAGAVRLARDWSITSGDSSCNAAIGDRLRIELDYGTSVATVTNLTTPDTGAMTVLNMPTNPERFGVAGYDRFSRNPWFADSIWGVV